jgi:hypothetical protein
MRDLQQYLKRRSNSIHEILRKGRIWVLEQPGIRLRIALLVVREALGLFWRGTQALALDDRRCV